MLNRRDLLFELTDPNDPEKKYRITSIADTRGYRHSAGGKYSGDGVRKDYEQYLDDEMDNTLCLLVENYKACSGGDIPVLTELMKYNIKPSYRTGLDAVLINWRTGDVYDNKDNEEELEDFDEEEMEDVPSEEELVQKRVEQVRYMLAHNRMHQKGVNFIADHIFAYNPLSGYTLTTVPKKGERIVSYDAEIASEQRNQVLSKLFRMIEKERKQIEDKITENYEMLMRFLESGDISILVLKQEVLETLRKKAWDALQLVERDMDEVEFYKYYQRKLGKFHSRAYKPLALHKGEYRYYETVSLFDINNELSDFYISGIGELKKMLVSYSKEIRESCEGAKGEQALLTTVDNIIENMISSLEDYSDETLYEQYQQVIKSNHYFGDLSGVWEVTGKRAHQGGNGVNADIRQMFLECIDEEKERETLRGTFRKRFLEIQADTKKVMEKIVQESF